MRIVAATRVRNEEDIIEAQIRHHAGMVDAHLLLDNGSTDTTPGILAALRNEGLALHVIADGTAHFADAAHNTLLYRRACTEFAADWVVFLDADEFIDPRGFASLAQVLAGIGAEHLSVGMRLRNYEAGPPDAADERNVLRRLTRRATSPTDVWKVIVRGRPDPSAVEVDHGNHQILVDGAARPPLRQHAVMLAHYPNRSPFHWAGKAAVGWLKVLAAGERLWGCGTSAHYAPSFRDFSADPRAWIAAAQRAAVAQAADPALIDDPLPYRGTELRYTPTVDYAARAIAQTLTAAEEIAIAHGRLIEAHDPPKLRSDLYRRATLAEIAAQGATMPDGRRRAEAFRYAGAETLVLPPFAYGSTASAVAGEAAGRILDRPSVYAWLLRDVTVHGQYGVITLDDTVLAETLHHLPLHRMPGAGYDDADHLRLPQRTRMATLPVAGHLLGCNLTNYFHWLIDVAARYSTGQFTALGSAQQAPGAPVLLVPELDVFWKWETLNLLLPETIPRVALAADANVFVQRLLFIPDLSGGGLLPHTALLGAFDTIRSAALGPGHETAVRPWRRLYIARTDSTQRTLLNEAEVMARAEQAGFTPVELSRLPVGEQVRLFAEATHILAPHGAGLTNIGFCRPGTKLCELHIDSCLRWSYRRLAALRGMSYGCVVGETVAHGAWVHSNTWRIDPDAVAAVLCDPRFVGG
jgi:capsular polysaccharide biosynthesis protein